MYIAHIKLLVHTYLVFSGHEFADRSFPLPLLKDYITDFIAEQIYELI